MRWQEQIYQIVLTQIQKRLCAELASLETASVKSPETLSLLGAVGLADSPSESARCRHHMEASLAYLFGYERAGQSIRTSYHHFLLSLRRALDTEFYGAHAHEPARVAEVELLQALAAALYTGVHIQSFQNDFVKRVAAKGGVPIVSSEADPPLLGQTVLNAPEKIVRIKKRFERLVPIYQALKRGKPHLGMRGRERLYLIYLGAVTWASLDLSLYGSVASIKFCAARQDGAEALHFIRMSTPTIGSNEQTRINPEFKAYLAYLRTRGLRHTYISYQDNAIPQLGRVRNFTRLIKYLGITDESYRARALERSAAVEFADTLDVLTLAKDSAFYLQRRRSDYRSQEACAFLSEFMGQLFDSEGEGYHVPARWRRSGAPERSEVQALLAELHEVFFDSASYLDRGQRQNFLEIAYALIVDYASRDAFSANQTCKDGIDRAGAANAFSYTLLLILAVFDDAMSESMFESHLESLIAMVFSDALLSKQREIMRLRLLRFQQAVAFLLERVLVKPQTVERLHKLLHARAPLLEWDELVSIEDPALLS